MSETIQHVYLYANEMYDVHEDVPASIQRKGLTYDLECARVSGEMGMVFAQFRLSSYNPRPEPRRKR